MTDHVPLHNTYTAQSNPHLTGEGEALIKWNDWSDSLNWWLVLWEKRSHQAMSLKIAYPTEPSAKKGVTQIKQIPQSHSHINASPIHTLRSIRIHAVRLLSAFSSRRNSPIFWERPSNWHRFRERHWFNLIPKTDGLGRQVTTDTSYGFTDPSFTALGPSNSPDQSPIYSRTN